MERSDRRSSGLLLNPECELESLGAGMYGVEATQAWWGQESLHGGYVLALVVSAVERELTSGLAQLRNVSLQFLRPVLAGALRVEVTVERSGRRVSSATVRVHSLDRLAAVGMAWVSGRTSNGEVTLETSPRVAPYDPAENETGPELPGLQRRVWLQPRGEHGGGAPSRSIAWVAPRTPEPIDHRWMSVVSDLLIPNICRSWDTWRALQTVDMSYHPRCELPREDQPPGSPVLVVLTNRVSAEGVGDQDIEMWTKTGSLIAQARQMFIVGEPLSARVGGARPPSYRQSPATNS